MNLFILDNDIEKSAQAHVDKHCIKMILESAQLLCTAIRLHGGRPITVTDPLGKNKLVYLLPGETYSFISKVKKDKKTGQLVVYYALELSTGLYIQTHINHPCAVWVRESLANFYYLSELTMQLNEEYKFRFKKRNNHKSFTMLCDSNTLELADKYYPYGNEELTPIALCIPDEYKVEGDAVQSYRNYYNGAKRKLFKWTNRYKPEWVN